MTTTPVHEPITSAINPFRYRRRATRVVMVGDVGVGGQNPIRVQSMTTTRTQDVAATAAQAERLVRAGCEIVRITAPTVRDARAIGEVRTILRSRGIRVPLVADIHFSPEAALAAADYVEKVRINPGNYADSRKFAVREYSDAAYAAELERIEERVTPLIRKLKERGLAQSNVYQHLTSVQCVPTPQRRSCARRGWPSGALPRACGSRPLAQRQGRQRGAAPVVVQVGSKVHLRTRGMHLRTRDKAGHSGAWCTSGRMEGRGIQASHDDDPGTPAGDKPDQSVSLPPPRHTRGDGRRRGCRRP